MISLMILHIQHKNKVFLVYHIGVSMSPLPQDPTSLCPRPQVPRPLRVHVPKSDVPESNGHVPVPMSLSHS